MRCCGESTWLRRPKLSAIAAISSGASVTATMSYRPCVQNTSFTVTQNVCAKSNWILPTRFARSGLNAYLTVRPASTYLQRARVIPDKLKSGQSPYRSVELLLRHNPAGKGFPGSVREPDSISLRPIKRTLYGRSMRPEWLPSSW